MTSMHTLGITLLIAVSASALAQNKAAPTAPAAKPAVSAPATQAAPATAPATKPATAAAAAPAADKADAPKKKRAIKRKPRTACTQLDDPWGNVCNIQKNAELACKDLPTGKKAAKKSAKGKPPATTGENRRQQCVDNYMRNV